MLPTTLDEAFPMIIQLAARLHETLVANPQPASIVATLLGLYAGGTRLFSMLVNPRGQQRKTYAMIEWICFAVTGFLVFHYPLTSVIMGAIWIGIYHYFLYTEGHPYEYYASTREEIAAHVVVTWIASAFLARCLSKVWRSFWDVCFQCVQNLLHATIVFPYNTARYIAATIFSGIVGVLGYCFPILQDSRDNDYSYSEDDESQNDIAWKSEYYQVIDDDEKEVNEMAYQHDLGSVYTDNGRRSRRLIMSY